MWNHKFTTMCLAKSNSAATKQTIAHPHSKRVSAVPSFAVPTAQVGRCCERRRASLMVLGLAWQRHGGKRSCRVLRHSVVYPFAILHLGGLPKVITCAVPTEGPGAGGGAYLLAECYSCACTTYYYYNSIDAPFFVTFRIRNVIELTCSTWPARPNPASAAQPAWVVAPLPAWVLYPSSPGLVTGKFSRLRGRFLKTRIYV